MRSAGIVLKVGDLVYLRPQEVTAMVMRVRPPPDDPTPFMTPTFSVPESLSLVGVCEGSDAQMRWMERQLHFLLTFSFLG